jgi:predicted HTH domain antitoxin
MSKKITIELPNMVKLPEDEVEERVKLELAIRLYEKGILSFGQARKLANMSKWNFIEILKKENIGIPYDENEFREDLKVIEGLK